MEPLDVLRQRYAEPDARALMLQQERELLDAYQPQASASEAAAARMRRPYKGLPAPGSSPLPQHIMDFMLPDTPLDLALSVVGGPFGKLMGKGAKAGLVAGSAYFDPTEAQAGPVKGIKSAADQFWHGISGIKLPQPLSEYFSTHEPRATIVEKKVSPAAYEGKNILPTVGDTTRADSWLTHVQGDKLPEPVALQGGGRFPSVKENKPDVWMASDAQMKGLLNRSEQISKNTGRETVVMPTALGGSGGDYSHNVWNPLAQRLNDAQHKISDEGWVAFNQAMRRVDPDFPGIGISRDKMLDYLKGSAREPRTNFVQTMDTRRFQNEGFPDVAAVRHAATDPKLLHAPLGSSGYSSFTLDPVKGIRPVDTHGTYTHAGAGKNFGTMGVIAPPEIMFPDVMDSLRKMAAESGKPVKKYTGRPDYYFAGRMPEKLKSGEPLTLAQHATPQWVDTMSEYKRLYNKVGGEEALASGMTLDEIVSLMKKRPDRR